MQADLILDTAAAGQLVAVCNCDDDGRFKEKRIPSLKKNKGKKTGHIEDYMKNETMPN